MQSIRLLMIGFFGTVIFCGALLMIGCSGSSSGGDNVSYNLDCPITNVPSSAQCDIISSSNFCQKPFTYDPNSKTCNIYACLYCSH